MARLVSSGAGALVFAVCMEGVDLVDSCMAKKKSAKKAAKKVAQEAPEKLPEETPTPPVSPMVRARKPLFEGEAREVIARRMRRV